jgi:tRNA A-37 threonylcarbamoyl transferase component Bud32
LITALPEPDQRALIASLARMNLLADRERPNLLPLVGGISSLIVKADLAIGPVCVKRALPQLKVSADWRVPVERNRAEVAWLGLAAGVHPGCVPRLRGDDPIGNAFAMEYLDPKAYPVWKAQLMAGVVEIATAMAVGGQLAAIHRATAGNEEVARRFATDATFRAIRLDPYLAAAGRVHPTCSAALDALIVVTASTKLALVHGDVSPKNILVGPEGPVFLDAECAWYGDPAFDLAFCLNHLFLKCLYRPDRAEPLLEAASAMRAAYLGVVDWEQPPTLEARVARLLPGLMLARVSGKSPVEYLTAGRDKDRVWGFAERHLLTPVETVPDLVERWHAEVCC